MRVYLPSTLPALSRQLAATEIGPAPVRAYAVTPALREWYSSGDVEELEYIALLQAAKASLRLMGEDPHAPRRRVVLAADVPGEQVSYPAGFDDPALVQVAKPVLLRDVVAGHVDSPEAEADVAAAVAALPAADHGDEDARFAVDSAEGHELLWYATQELEHLARDVR
jgi:hypothetical protein